MSAKGRGGGGGGNQKLVYKAKGEGGTPVGQAPSVWFIYNYFAIVIAAYHKFDLEFTTSKYFVRPTTNSCLWEGPAEVQRCSFHFF